MHGRRPNSSYSFVQEFVTSYGIESIIISSVIDIPANERDIIDRSCPKVVWFNSNTPIPLNIDYKTPHTLGSDRLAAAIGAMYEAPAKNLLIIDAGTAITVDFVDAERNFKGGNISPGIKMRLRALHEFTGRLPLIEKEGPVPSLGYDTETAIRSGVINGICQEIDGYINKIKEIFPDVLIFLTGGDEKTLINNIKSRIFADRFLVAKGLNHILEYIR